MICKQCGKEIADGSRFCIGCGAPQGAPTPAPVTAPAPGQVCPGCGRPVAPGNKFCMGCGRPMTQAPAPQPAPMPVYDPTLFVPDYGFGNVAPAPARVMDKKEFLDQDTAFKKEIKQCIIICYVCVVLSAVVALAFAPMGLIDTGLLLAITLGLQFTKHPGFAWALLVLAVIEAAIGYALTGTPTSIVWVAAGVSAVMAFQKVGKRYKQYLAQANNPPMPDFPF